MRLGLGSYTFTWAIGVPGFPPARPMTPLGLLAEARRLDVRVVQVCDNLPLASLPAGDLDAFASLARESGVSVELGTRGLTEENLRAHLALALRLGSPFLRVVTDRPGDEPSPAQVIDRLRAVLPDFARAGVKVALENHDRFDSRTLASIVVELGAERVGICLDTVNSFGALEGPAVVVPTLAPYTLSLHVKDFTVRRPSHQMGFVVEGCAAGTGRLDLPWLLGVLRETGREIDAILETWVTPGPTLDETIALERAWTDRGIAHLRNWIRD